MSVPKRVYSEPGHEVEILLAFEVVEENTFAALKGDGIAVVGGEKKALFKIGDLIEAGHGLIVKRTDAGHCLQPETGQVPSLHKRCFVRRDAASRGPACSDQHSLFVSNLRSSPGIFWIQPGRGHDGASQLFGGNDKRFGWRLATGIFLGGGRDEAIAPSDYGLQVLRLVGIVRQGAADLADGGIYSLLPLDGHLF